MSEGRVLEHPVVAGLRVAVAGLDPERVLTAWQLGDSDVETGLATLLDLQARAAALEGALLGEARVRDLKSRTRASNVERWLGDRFRLSQADAAARVREAALLGRHPAVAGALGRGEVTVEQAGVVAAALDRVVLLPDLAGEDRERAARFLLGQCAALAPRDLARAGRAVLEALTTRPSTDDPADAAAVEREHARAEADAQAGERNDLRVIRRRGRLRALLDLGPLGEATLQGWLRRADRPHPGEDGFEDRRGLSERRGDALVDLLSAAGTDGTGSRPEPPAGGDGGADDEVEAEHEPDPEPDPGGPDPGLFDDTWPTDAGDDDTWPTDAGDEDTGPDDGEVERAELDDAEAENPGSPGGPPDPVSSVSPLALLTVTTTLAELRAGLAGAARLDTGATLSAATLRQLACDALVVPAVLGGPSQVLDLGRTTRLWNRAQRRAAALRDRGCVAPGCDQPPAACQLHHSWHWTDGGPTDLHNGALLCGFHHRMVHRQGWAIVLATNGYPQLIPPASIDPDRRPRQHHRFRLTLLTGRHRG